MGKTWPGSHKGIMEPQDILGMDATQVQEQSMEVLLSVAVMSNR